MSAERRKYFGKQTFPAILSFLLLTGLACAKAEKPITPTPTPTIAPLPISTAALFENIVTPQPDPIDMDLDTDRKKFCGSFPSEVYFGSTQTLALENNSVIARFGVEGKNENSVYYSDRNRSGTVIWEDGDVKAVPLCGNAKTAVKRNGNTFVVGFG
ncbi:MAG: hypothetical protein HY425_02615 [Candidatus Levybacteria bacterium]|nr:hypothetical protein [Candidatus Levybacteria bacterium]